MDKDESLIETAISSESIYNGKIIKVFRDTVRLPDGKESLREVVRHPGAVCVVPVTDSGEILCVRQFRYPFSRVTTEIPAGKSCLRRPEHPARSLDLSASFTPLPRSLTR